ncbi:RNA-directed DNA polymerase, eukaryota [Tanacetum coccineum]
MPVQRSNEDQVVRISKSIFVTNFPDNLGSKELWKVCEGYGKVIDVFIPNRRSKAGKRFAFVRFIRVNDLDRLVGNLCTIWIGRFHLHANVARFERANKPVKPSGPSQSNAHGDPLAPYLFILIMESLHISFSRVVDDGLFKGFQLHGSVNISHLFYADDAMFIGEWRRIDRVLFEHSCRSLAANRIGCAVLNTPFRYLGVTVGECMSRKSAWVGLVNKLQARLSKWKVKTLSIGGRLTLLKSVLGASPIYYMSIFKVPKGVLKTMESIRSKFFNGVDSSDRKISWVAWDNVLASKLNGGLGVSSFFALNRALLLKWVWRFISGDGSLWCKVIQAIYGSKFDLHVTDQPSIWCSILREVKSLKDSGFDFSSHCKKRIGDGSCTSFWYDIWLADAPLCVQFPRLFALELDKEIVVANKMGASSVSASFRRDVRDGAERQQWDDLSSIMNSVVLSSSKDRWTCDLSGDGEFKVKVIRNFIDDLFLPSSDVATRWVKFIPIKVNVFSWRARRDRLPTRVNLSRRGVLLDSHLCPLCNAAMEDVQHVFFRCDVARVVLRKICRWWDLDWQEICSFSDWDAWFLSFRLSSRLKSILEGVFYVAWWRIWRLRNQLVFDASPPNRSTIFDDIALIVSCDKEEYGDYIWIWPKLKKMGTKLQEPKDVGQEIIRNLSKSDMNRYAG